MIHARLLAVSRGFPNEIRNTRDLSPTTSSRRVRNSSLMSLVTTTAELKQKKIGDHIEPVGGGRDAEGQDRFGPALLRVATAPHCAY